MILTRRIRKPFWILKSFIQKHRLIIFSATFFGVLVFLFFQNLLPLIPRPKANLKVGIVGQYTLNTLPNRLAQTISRGLTKINSKGEIEPDIARSWEVLEDNTLYRFYLNPDVIWGDATLLKSQDIKLEIPNVTIAYPSDQMIEFKLKEPFSPFLSLVSQPLFKDQTISAGQYIIRKVKYQGSYLKNLELVGSQNNLTYRFYSSNQTAWLGFKLGEIDQLENLVINPLTDKWVKKVDLVESINYHQYLAILFNLKDDKLGNKPLRQALAYATKEKAESNDTRALSPISPQSWAYNSKVKPYSYSPTQAKELFDNFEEEASVSGKLKIKLGTSQSFLSLAESIANSWEEVLPVDVEVKIINSIEPDFQALLIAQEIPLDPDQHALWHSTQEANISNYSDLKVDKLLEDGRKEMNQNTRLEIYQDFQRFLVEESPAIFLRFPTTYTISRK